MLLERKWLHGVTFCIFESNSTFMKMTLKIIFLLSLAVMTSCVASFRISVIEPAEIKVPETVRVIGVINNISNENSPEKVISTVLGAEQLNGNVVAGEQAVNGVLRSLGDYQGLSGMLIEYDSMRFEDGSLNWEYLDSMAVKDGIHGYIELSELKSVSPVGGTVLANAAGQSSNKLQGTLFTNVHVVESGEFFRGYSVRYTYNIPISGSTNILQILNDMQRKREYYSALGFQLGYKAAGLVYPHWVWVNRNYYKRGSRPLKNAAPMIKNGNWDIAERQLLVDVDNVKIKKRGRVLFNLALVKEGQGDLDAAIQYAERAALECGDKLANSYLVQLRQRKFIMEQQ